MSRVVSPLIDRRTEAFPSRQGSKGPGGIMDISLMHAGLAAGATLAAIPVILHLFMRQTPKHVIFPALRLIRERHKRSKKQLKVKNWLLLAARMLILALMALALARPTLNSETSLGDQEVATAPGVRLRHQHVDAIHREGKRPADRGQGPGGGDPQEDHRGQRGLRLRLGRPDQAAGGLARLGPEADRCAGASRGEPPAQRRAGPGGARPWAASNLPRREVYVLTDLASSAWELGSTRTIEELEKLRKGKKLARTYILKLTPKEVKDLAVVSAEPTASVVTEGEPVEVKATLRASGPGGERSAEFWLNGTKKDQKLVRLPANGEQEVTFVSPSRLESGLHQGMIKLGNAGADFMAFDDVRYFTFTTQPSMRVLIVADVATASDLDALFVMTALSPSESIAPGVGSSPYKIERQTRRGVPGAETALAEGLRGGLPPERRRPLGHRLGQALGLCPRRGRPDRGTRQPRRGFQLRSRGLGDPAGHARREEGGGSGVVLR